MCLKRMCWRCSVPSRSNSSQWSRRNVLGPPRELQWCGEEGLGRGCHVRESGNEEDPRVIELKEEGHELVFHDVGTGYINIVGLCEEQPLSVVLPRL